MIKIIPHAALVVGASLLIVSCSKSNNNSVVVKRADEPDYIRVSDNKEMDAAIDQAKKSVQKFITALQAPTAAQSSFSVKKPFTQGQKVEHIWLSPVTFDGQNFHGEVGDDPVDVTGVKLGDKVTVGKDEISDWMYVENGKLVGGYTVKALYSQMKPEEKADFLKQVDFKIE
jgi:uncharacterized protein YegJ (DUF2314 family)